MPRTTHGDRFTVTVIKEDEDHVTYELTSRVISFKVILNGSPEYVKLQVIDTSGAGV